jgi:subtilisin family serine protease
MRRTNWAIVGLLGFTLTASTIFSSPLKTPASNGEIQFKGVESVSLDEIQGQKEYGGKAKFLIDAEVEKNIPKGLLKKLKEVPTNNDLYVIQFSGPISKEDQESLSGKGVEVLEYIPAFAYVAKIKDSDTLNQVKTSQGVTEVTEFLPLYKFDPALFDKGASNLVKAVLKKTDKNIEKVSVKGIDELVDYAYQNEVLTISAELEYKLANDQAGVITKTNVAQSVYGLSGAGQIVAVADTGLDKGKNDATMHESFLGKINAIYSWGRTGDASDPHGHGTHVAGSVLGNASFKGMAPSANLVFQSIMDSSGGLGGLPTDLKTLFSQAWNAGARIHTNSWGAPVGGAYTTDSQAVDQYVYQNDMTILFAAGNEGPYARTISSPGSAKNAITVGASENNRPTFGSYADNTNQIAQFSSRGPTKDGRVKPDIVAPGTYILSSRSSLAPDSSFWANYNSKYAYMGGTSMATPLTAGNVALLKEHFLKNKGIDAKPSLIKAALVAGATNLGTTTGNQGWGRVNVEKSINAAYVNESTALTTGNKATYTFTATSSRPLKFTLAWTDYPGSPSATYSLVNDLDFVVKSPTGKVYVGNDTTSPYNNNWDGVNNVESVTIAVPENGTYTIEVQAYNVANGGSQDFSLALIN